MREIEQRSLAIAKWANLFMGAAGITAAIGSHASALMLDGLFSGVNFVAAILAARVAASIEQKPNALRPFGYEIDEAMYVMFRSLVLTGVVIVAGIGAVSKIVDYATGSPIAEIKLDWVVVYMGVMLVTCTILAICHHRNWLKTERKSDLLKAERSAAIIDGVLSAAAGAAFLLISLLKGTSLDFLVPVSDSVVVIGLVLYMIPTPIRSFMNAAKEVVGESAVIEVVDSWRQAVSGGLQSGFTLLEVSVTKVGRSQFAVAYVRPDKPASVEELDAVRSSVSRAASEIHSPSRMEVIFTGQHPFT